MTFFLSSLEQTPFLAVISKSSSNRATGNQFWEKKSERCIPLVHFFFLLFILLCISLLLYCRYRWWWITYMVWLLDSEWTNQFKICDFSLFMMHRLDLKWSVVNQEKGLKKLQSPFTQLTWKIYPKTLAFKCGLDLNCFYVLTLSSFKRL